MGDRDRQGFIIKTYSLILIMLSVTTFWCFLTYYSPGLKKFCLENIWLYYLTAVCVIAISIGLMCKYKMFQKAPNSYILLVVYTLTHSYLIGVIILFYKIDTIYQAAAATFGAFIALTGFAIYTKGDLTMKGGAIASLCNGLLWLIVFMFIFGTNNTLYTIFAIFAVFILGVFIVYDTQLIVGGKHRKFQLDPNDYAIGAIIIYSDIITMFIYILQIMGGSN